MRLVWRRGFDIAVAAAALTVSAVPLALSALAIKLTSRGPVVYRQVRIGQYGRPFDFYKLRTMAVNAEAGSQVTAAGDPRITAVGRVLRRLKLDELPQFWNVLVGDMSIIGPRPEVPRFVQRYAESERAILDILPGLASAAQLVVGNEADLLRGYDDAEEVYQRHLVPLKIEADLDYERRRNFRSDLRLMGELLLLIAGRSRRRPPAFDVPSVGSRS